MENELPDHIADQLQALGILDPLPDEVPLEPRRQHFFNMPDLDENGEPPW